MFFYRDDQSFIVEKDATLKDVVGYMSSWSAILKLEKRDGPEAVKKFIEDSKRKYVFFVS